MKGNETINGGWYFLKIAVFSEPSACKCLPRYFCKLQNFINPSSRKSMDKNKILTEKLGIKTLYLPPFDSECFAAYSPTLCTK